jgi:KAP family P-loop domain
MPRRKVLDILGDRAQDLLQEFRTSTWAETGADMADPKIDLSKPPMDCLQHDDLAKSIVRHICQLPPGSVIAIQGTWGSGKTDVLNRVHFIFQTMSRGSGPIKYPEPIFLAPWKFGTPNLVAPLVAHLVANLGSQRPKNEKFRRVIKGLLQAGNAMAFKAAGSLPFGNIIEAGQTSIDSLIDDLMQPKDGGSGPSTFDPVSEMGARFRDLVDMTLADVKGNPGLVICIDDLDRCLPDHQIAMLEAIHFLTASEARAYFLVAIDQRLVAEAATSHYGVKRFDTSQYLDKLFQLRVNLPSLPSSSLEVLLVAELGRRATDDGPTSEERLADLFGLSPDEIRETFKSVFIFPVLNNPRFVARIGTRLSLFLASEPGGSSLWQDFVRDIDDNLTVFEVLVYLLAISERWPEFRTALQVFDPTRLEQNIDIAEAYYGDKVTHQDASADTRAIVNLLPDKFDNPQFGEFLTNALNRTQERIGRREMILCGLDQALLRAGL